jgi:hypothetical protein
VPRGQEANFVQNNMSEEASKESKRVDADDEVQIVRDGEIKIQKARGGGARQTQHVYGGIAMQAVNMTNHFT